MIHFTLYCSLVMIAQSEVGRGGRKGRHWWSRLNRAGDWVSLVLKAQPLVGGGGGLGGCWAGRGNKQKVR